MCRILRNYIVGFGVLLPLQGDKQAKALFQVFVAFELKGQSFNPNETAVLEEINANTLEGIISVAAVRATAFCLLTKSNTAVCAAFCMHVEGTVPFRLQMMGPSRQLCLFQSLRLP